MIYKIKNKSGVGFIAFIGNQASTSQVSVPKNGYLCIEIPDTSKIELKVYLQREFANATISSTSGVAKGLRDRIIPVISKVLKPTEWSIYGMESEESSAESEVKPEVEDKPKRRRRKSN